MEAALPKLLPPDLDNHPTRHEAQLAYVAGLEALAKDPDVGAGQIRWLRRQHVAAINEHDWILVVQPNASEARLADANDAMVRLGNKLRDLRLAEGVSNVAPPPLVRAPFRGSAGQRSKQPQAPAEPPPWERKPVFMPAFLVSTTLPHRKPAGAEFTRVNGRVETTLVSTRRAGLPYGIYPRLILIHLATAAVRIRSRRLVVGRSLREMFGEMQIGDSGGADGQATMARAQLERLCTTTFVTTYRSKYGGHKLDVADQWLESTRGGLIVELSERFYAQATQSAVPLDPVILRRIRRSPLAIDIYGWITYRMATLQEPTAIPWASVERQFGSEYKEPRQFRRKFRESLGRIAEAWPGDLRVEAQQRRVVLTPSPPSVASRLERSNAKDG